MFTGFWVVFWSRFVSVWRPDSAELLMSADHVRHGITESKGYKQTTHMQGETNTVLPASSSAIPVNHSTSSPQDGHSETNAPRNALPLIFFTNISE